MRRLAVVLVAMVVGCLGLCGTSSAKSLAALLAARDPGARIGGNTIVATGNGGSVFAVPGRTNFIMALGAHATVRGGAGDDQLGALAKGVTIIAGGGEDLVIGGPEGTVVGGGSGHDLLVATQPDTTIKVNAPGDQVVVSGRDNQVVCSRRAAHELIYAGGGASVDKSCRDPDDRVLPLTQLAKPAAHAAAQPVTGDGRNVAYSSRCDKQEVDCTVSSFAPRTLKGLWANEQVPAYRCPFFRYLINKDYAPFGTALPYGVEVQGLGKIGVVILRTLREKVRPGPPPFPWVPVGTATGFYSGATNWTFGSNEYKVILHCTSDPGHSKYLEFDH